MHEEAKQLMSIRCKEDPKYPYRMTYFNKEGKTETFFFLADNRVLAGDHANHVCNVEGWKLCSVYREKP